MPYTISVVEIRRKNTSNTALATTIQPIAGNCVSNATTIPIAPVSIATQIVFEW